MELAGCLDSGNSRLVSNLPYLLHVLFRPVCKHIPWIALFLISRTISLRRFSFVLRRNPNHLTLFWQLIRKLARAYFPWLRSIRFPFSFYGVNAAEMILDLKWHRLLYLFVYTLIRRFNTILFIEALEKGHAVLFRKQLVFLNEAELYKVSLVFFEIPNKFFLLIGGQICTFRRDLACGVHFVHFVALKEVIGLIGFSRM